MTAESWPNRISTSNGKLTIELPRYVIDSKKQGNVDDNYAVFADGQYASADEIRTTAQARTLMVGFDNGTSTIEITGTQMGPVQSSNTNMTTSNMTTSAVGNNATNSGGMAASSSNSNTQRNHPVVSSTYSIPAAESVSIPFNIPSGVTSAYLSGTVLITGGLLSTIDFSIVNSDTGTVVMRQLYTDQGNIGIHIPAGSYTITLHNGSLLAGETHTVTLTLNTFY
jgi:hypothetical protein